MRPPRKTWIFAIIPTDPPGRRKIDRREGTADLFYGTWISPPEPHPP
jgi:hypothetical protein